MRRTPAAETGTQRASVYRIHVEFYHGNRRERDYLAPSRVNSLSERCRYSGCRKPDQCFLTAQARSRPRAPPAAPLLLSRVGKGGVSSRLPASPIRRRPLLYLGNVG